ncbi:hypothetical protein CDIK_2006 [Cucumispora dikerogammari]|nr:hypothetical protein CDIK_2006 [Cucumispora dikerogammari]
MYLNIIIATTAVILIGGSIVMFLVFYSTKEENSTTPSASASEASDSSLTKGIYYNKSQPKKKEQKSSVYFDPYARKKTTVPFERDNTSASFIPVKKTLLPQQRIYKTKPAYKYTPNQETYNQAVNIPSTSLKMLSEKPATTITRTSETIFRPLTTHIKQTPQLQQASEILTPSTSKSSIVPAQQTAEQSLSTESTLSENSTPIISSNESKTSSKPLIQDRETSQRQQTSEILTSSTSKSSIDSPPQTAERPLSTESTLSENSTSMLELKSKTASKPLPKVQEISQRQNTNKILTPSTVISSSKVDNQVDLTTSALDQKVVSTDKLPKKPLSTCILTKLKVKTGEELTKEMWNGISRSRKPWDLTLQFSTLAEFPQYNIFCSFMKDVFQYPKNLESTMQKLYSYLFGKEHQSIFSRTFYKSFYYLGRVDHPLKKLMQTNLDEALSDFFDRSPLIFTQGNRANNKRMFKESFENTLNIIRYSEEYKNIFQTKLNTQNIQVSFIEDDIESKEKINFKVPVKIEDNTYRFDTLNLIMNNEPLKNYILQTINKEDANKLNYLMKTQFNYNSQTDLSYIKDTFREFIDFNEDPFVILKKLLFDKRRRELEIHQQLCLGEIECSLTAPNSYQFKYRRIAPGPYAKNDHTLSYLPIISLNIKDVIARSFVIANNNPVCISIQDAILDYKSRVHPPTFPAAYDILDFKSMSLFVNQFPFLIVKVTKASSQTGPGAKTINLICEKTLKIADLNEGLNEYELTGFIIENKDLRNTPQKQPSVFESFNFYNNELQAVSRKYNDIRSLCSIGYVNQNNIRGAIDFKIKPNNNKGVQIRMRYLLYKKISKTFSKK